MFSNTPSDEVIEQYTGVDILIKHLKIDLFALQLICDLAQMQCRTGLPVQPGHNERIPFPHIFEACFQSGTFA